MSDVEAATAASQVERLRAAINERLAHCLRLGAGCPETLLGAMRHSLLAPGKRLRPMLVLLAAEACGCRAEVALPAACAVEMVHTYSLIHDDLPAMDNDDLRRGLPTCHRVYGEAMAILAGDALLALAFETLARELRPPMVAARACAALGAAAGPCRLVGGQADDMASLPPTAGLDALESIHARKTGAMFEVSLALGAIVAEADDVQEEALREFGRCFGLAFQITDDLLDVRGDERSAGKRLGKDQHQQKLTFPGLLGAEESARRASDLLDTACAALAPWGARADVLRCIARQMLKRTH